MKKNNKQALTLIELIIVTAILAVISLAIYSSLNNGLKIWQKVNKAIPEEDVGIFFEKFSRDLRNCVKFSSLNFVGQPGRLDFASLVNSPRLGVKTVGQITYLYDVEQKQLNRIQKDFSQIFSGEEVVNPALGNLKSLRFLYYVRYENSKERVWLEECPPALMPLAVKIELEFGDDDQIQKFARTVTIPIGG